MPTLRSATAASVLPTMLSAAGCAPSRTTATHAAAQFPSGPYTSSRWEGAPRPVMDRPAFLALDGEMLIASLAVETEASQPDDAPHTLRCVQRKSTRITYSGRSDQVSSWPPYTTT